MTSILKVDTIQNSTGTDALSIGADGSITPQAGFTGAYPQLAGLFFKQANQSVASQDWTEVEWDSTAGYNPDNIKQTGNVIFKPASTGWYKFEWRIIMSQSDSGKGIKHYLVKNNVNIWYDNRPTGSVDDGGGGGPHGAPLCIAYAECTTANSDEFKILLWQASGGRIMYGYDQNSRYDSTLAIYKMT